MKKVLSAVACAAVLFVGGVAQADTITGMGHIYNGVGTDGIDDWYFNVGNVSNTSRVWITLDTNYISGTGFDSQMYLFTDNNTGLNQYGSNREQLIAGNDDQVFLIDLSSYITANVSDRSNYQLRISEYLFSENEAWGTSNIVSGDWFYSITISSERADLSWNSTPDAVAPVPEPTTMLLFGTGLAGLAAVGRRRKA